MCLYVYVYIYIYIFMYIFIYLFMFTNSLDLASESGKKSEAPGFRRLSGNLL